MRKAEAGKICAAGHAQNYRQASPHLSDAVEAQRISHVGKLVWDLTTDKYNFQRKFSPVAVFPRNDDYPRNIFNFLHPDDEAQVSQEFHMVPLIHFQTLNIESSAKREIRTVHTRVKKPTRMKTVIRFAAWLHAGYYRAEENRDALKESEWRNRIVSELTTDYFYSGFVPDEPPTSLASENMSRITGGQLTIANIHSMEKHHPSRGFGSFL